MLTHISSTRTGLALATSMAILYIICSAIYALVPQFAMGMQMMAFHQVGSMVVNATLLAFLCGFGFVVVAGYAAGALLPIFITDFRARS